MTQTTWSHLPNAKHIDRIIADLGKNTGAWTAAWDAEWYAAWNAASADARTVARGAILALIAYDDCAYLLDEKPEHVQMLGLLGNQAALLLYPACVAMQKEINEI